MTRKPTTRSPKTEPSPPPQPPPTWDEKFINGLIPWRVEIGGLVLFAFAMITLLALPSLTEAGWLKAWNPCGL